MEISASPLAEEFRREKRWLILNRNFVLSRVEKASNKKEKVNDVVLKWLNDVKKLLEEMNRKPAGDKWYHEMIDKIKSLNSKRKFDPFSIPSPTLDHSTSSTNSRIQIQRSSQSLPTTHSSSSTNSNSSPTPSFSSRNLVHSKSQTLEVSIPTTPSLDQSTFLAQGLEGLHFNSTQKALEDELLKNLQDDSICTIGLYGNRGSGKTTLVKELGEKANHLNIFDVVLFATVSENPNISAIQDQIARSLNQVRFGNEGVFGRALKIKLALDSMNKILVILDDVPEKFDLESIGIPYNNKLCKFLLTARRKKGCALMIGNRVIRCQITHHMCPLSKDEAMMLLQDYSGIDDDDDDDDDSKEVLHVAKQVVLACNRLPGTIIDIGSTLKGKPIEEWKKLLDSLKHSTARYQIFLSFRGEDTRRTFTHSLYIELINRGFKTFMDHELNIGDQISTKLVKAIEDSRLSIIVLSKNYAGSSWCLDELVHILNCKKTKNQLVWPIFYNVDPSDIRHLRNDFGKAFAELGVRYPEKIEKWKFALSQVPSLTGKTYIDGRNVYHDFIQDIVGEATKIKNYLYIQSRDMD